MKRTSKTARGKRQQRAEPTPSGGGASTPVVALPDEPDMAGADQTQRVGSGAVRDPAQTDIERAKISCTPPAANGTTMRMVLVDCACAI